MKLFLFALVLVSCSSSPGTYREEKNKPQFSASRSYVEPPKEVLRAAQGVLENFTRESDPPAARAIKGDDDSVRTGWVYLVSKDKYVEFQSNGRALRKPLALRRKYEYTVTPSLTGTDVTFSVDEEIQEIDLTTGEARGWKSVSADPAAYDLMARRLREAIRAQ